MNKFFKNITIKCITLHLFNLCNIHDSNITHTYIISIKQWNLKIYEIQLLVFMFPLYHPPGTSLVRRVILWSINQTNRYKFINLYWVKTRNISFQLIYKILKLLNVLSIYYKFTTTMIKQKIHFNNKFWDVMYTQ